MGRSPTVADDGEYIPPTAHRSVVSTYVYRFVGLEALPARLTDLQQFFQLGTSDVEAIRQRFRSDRRVAAALQLLFLRACGRPMDRFSVLPRNLLRYVAEALEGVDSFSVHRLTVCRASAGAGARLQVLDLVAIAVRFPGPPSKGDCVAPERAWIAPGVAFGTGRPCTCRAMLTATDRGLSDRRLVSERSGCPVIWPCWSLAIRTLASPGDGHGRLVRCLYPCCRAADLR
ncbi:MAG: DUF4158 domain-containing protein [Comamonadaceae bacterium]|nr:MAG: DUF4158 domain-containing protein [Comamonadaceae bacterium]